MVKTYLDILSERGIRPFLTDEAFEELQKFDYKSQYASPGQVMPVFKHPNQHKIELGKTTNLIGDKKYSAKASEMRRALADHLSERGDEWVRDGKLQTRSTTLLYSPNFPKN